RYFKTSLKLPEEFAFMEAQLESLLRKRISRGSVILKLFVRDLSESAAQDINTAAIQHYIAQLSQTVRGGQGNFTIDLATLAMLPGVCQPQELDDSQRERAEQIIEKLANEAIDRMVQMRTVEGRALAADLQGHCRAVREQIEAIRGKV